MSQKVDFKYDDGSEVFFTSDTHFNHSNIINFCKRPFKDVEEMNEQLISNWNDTVPTNGLVFHLGDFAWGGFQQWKKVRERLNGEIILIRGNHDEKNGPQSEYDALKLFKNIARQMKIEIGGRQVILNHFPFLCYGGTYRDKDSMVFQLFGHTHTSNVMKRNNGKDFERCIESLFPTQYDVGVDFNDFKPISWDYVNNKILTQVEMNENLKKWISDE